MEGCRVWSSEYRGDELPGCVEAWTEPRGRGVGGITLDHELQGVGGVAEKRSKGGCM